MDNLQTLLADFFGPRTASHYTRLDYLLLRLQHLDPRNALYFGFSGQHANKNLDTSEQFYLDGPSAVRGYDVGLVLGAEGNLTTIEYRHDFTVSALPGPWQVSGFIDSGRVQAYKAPFLLDPNSARLSSAGMGLHWSAPHAWVIGAMVATPVGNTPALAGTHVSRVTRFWLQVQTGFY